MRRGLVYQNYTSQISPSAEPGCCLRQRHASRLIVLFNPQPTLVVHFGPFCCPSFPSFILHSTLDIPSDRHTTASVSCSSFSPFLLLIYNLPVVPFRHPFPLQLPRGSEARTSYPIAYARGIHLPCDLFANACCAEGQRQWHLGFGPVLGCLPDGQEGAEHHSLP